MGVSIQVFLEVARGGVWMFIGEIVANPEHAYGLEDPAVMSFCW